MHEHMFVHPKPAERQRARELRTEGMPYKRIAADLDVAVNSVYRWTSDIELTPEQEERNRSGPNGPQHPLTIARRAQRWSTVSRAKRAAYQAAGRARAQRGDDPLHMQGCMLYWAEGSKGRNVIHFANSDVAMVVVFRRFLRGCMEVPDHRVCLALNAYTNNGLTIDEIEAHWLATLGLPASCVRKHMVNHMPTSSSGRAKNRLIYGVCSLKVGSTPALQHIYGAIQEYGGFEEPRWLG